MSTQPIMERLRSANPVRAERVANDELLTDILALPGDTRLGATPQGRTGRMPRRLALVGLVSLVLCGSGWAATQFELHLFGNSATPSTPAELRSAFARDYSGGLAIDPPSIGPIGTFTTPRGTVTVYAARAKYGDGFVTQYVDSHGQIVTYMGFWPSAKEARLIGKALVVSSNSLNGMFDGVWQVWGIAPAGTTDLELHFQDGTMTVVPTHDGFFAYLAGGATCEPGHKPVSLVAIDRSGAILDRADTQISQC